jgi:hypothetical protein
MGITDFSCSAGAFFFSPCLPFWFAWFAFAWFDKDLPRLNCLSEVVVGSIRIIV